MTSLVSQPRGVVFADLKELCHLTDGNLSRHLQVLHEAGFVEIWKGLPQEPPPDPLPDHRRRPAPVPRIHQRPRNRRPGRPEGRPHRDRRRHATPTSPKAGRPPERTRMRRRTAQPSTRPVTAAMPTLHRQVLVGSPKSCRPDVQRQVQEGGVMRVIRADVLGMCFGVRDALAVIDGIDEPRRSRSTASSCTMRSCRRGSRRGGSRCGTRHERRTSLPETPAVLITAHGISDRERSRLEAAGKRLVDTTCPLVTRVHQAAQALQAEGYHVLVIGRRGHVEVEGIIEDLDRFRRDRVGRRGRGLSASSAGDRLPDDGHRAARRRDPRGDRRAEPRRRDQVRRHGLPADQGAPARPRAAARTGRRGRGRRRAQLEQHAASWSRAVASAASPRSTSSRPTSSIRPGSRTSPRSV